MTETAEEVPVGSRWRSRKSKRLAEVVAVNIKSVEFRYVLPQPGSSRRPGMQHQWRWQFLDNFTKEK